MVDDIETDRWYWDRRTEKALYPHRVDDGTVEFRTVWHAEEVADALDSGALVPLAEVGAGEADRPLDLVDSFRLPDGIEGTDDPPDGATTGAESGGDTDGE